MKEPANVAARLARLETSLLRTQQVAASLAVALLLLVSVAAFQGPEKSKDLTVKRLYAETISITGPSEQKYGPVLWVNGSTSGRDGPASYGIDSKGMRIATASYEAALSVSEQEGWSCLSLAGPPRPGATINLLGKESPAIMQERVAVKYSAAEGGSAIILKDSMDRERVVLGAQQLTAGGQVTSFPESAFTLWDETGKALHHVGTK